jgi:hypothetical protein
MHASMAPINAKLATCCDGSFQRQIGSEIEMFVSRSSGTKIERETHSSSQLPVSPHENVKSIFSPVVLVF